VSPDAIATGMSLRPASAPVRGAVPLPRPRDPSWHVVLTLQLACLVLQGCILFTDSVNSPPTVQIEVPDGTFARGQMILLTANASDPDGDAISLSWSTSMGYCPNPPDATQRPPATYLSPAGTPTFSYTFKSGDPSKVCVWVLATDARGAWAFDAKPVSSEDRPPVAAITVLEPTTMASNGMYELYSTFRLSAAASTDPDGDPISAPQWQLTSPQTSTAGLMPCPGTTTSDLLQCLYVGAVPGAYTVALTVSDGIMPSATMTKTLMVDNDHPACVSQTDPNLSASPIVLDPEEAKTLTVTEVLDDGAPLPAPATGDHTTLSFAWQVRRNGGAFQTIVGYDNVNALTLPAGTYASGDTVDVNVTISDGVAMHLDPACDPGCPPGCPQSAQWTLEYR
jgi:hypothetical protein